MKRIFKLITLVMAILLVNNSKAQKIPVWKLSDLKAAIENAKQPTIVNFWATFCKPCIAELPYFQTIVDKYKAQGLKLILVSLDLKESYPQNLIATANKLNLNSPVFYLDESNADLFVPVVDSSWSGAIPASLFINNKTGYHKFFEDELSKEKLEAEIKKML